MPNVKRPESDRPRNIETGIRSNWRQDKENSIGRIVRRFLPIEGKRRRIDRGTLKERMG